MVPTKPQCQSCHSHTQDPTLSGRDAESFINHACAVLRSIYGTTPDNRPDPRLCAAPPPQLSRRIQGLYFPEPLQTRQPTVSWYIANLAYYARASAGVFHTAIAYLERAQPRFKPNPADPRTAFVAALVLAHRFLEDGSYKTDTWARLSGSSARMISACVEAMFDALEHRLWIGPLPNPAHDGMFSMREGTIFCEEMIGGQRRCSLPSLSVLYGACRSNRAFGDPQSIPAPIPEAAGPSTATAATTVAVQPVPKAVQGLPSPPDSPSSASATPPLTRATTAQPARHVIPMPEVVAPASVSVSGNFNYAQWQAGAQMSTESYEYSAVSLPPPPAPNPSIQHTLSQYRLPPPPLHVPPRVVQPDESPVFDAARWCASESQPQLDRSESMDVDVSPPDTPADSDTFNPIVWAAQGALITPAPTIHLGEKHVRYPHATLMPPAMLDPMFHGRRHSR
ncbi:hypothetical protein RhiLY_11691 [Ceratobasidium sp. AG-Ba]|nr:hypothetical protein RhiLY_11691 [Ceratobasidium sp. AG-Ba]